MGTFYIDRAGGTLRASQGVMAFAAPDGAAATRVPLNLVDRVVIRAETTVDSSTLAALCAAGTAVVILGGRTGDRVAQMIGPWHNAAWIRVQQWETLRDPSQRAQLARALVRAKAVRQERTLVTLMSRRPDLRKPLFDARASVRTCREKLANSSLDIPAIRGLEGACAAAYFGGFFQAFPASLGATGRRRRPAPDPVNAMLSLSYTLLYGSATQACWRTGLDPAVGALHEPDHGRASMACDLMEPWRPVVDLLVWDLFASLTLRVEHFGTEGAGHCLLGKAGRARFYEAWEPHGRRLDAQLTRLARALVRQLKLQAAHPVDNEGDQGVG